MPAASKTSEPVWGWVTVPTYPLFAPYKVMPDSGPRAFVGKPVRYMTLITDTLVIDHDPCYDPDTRILRFTGEWQRLARITGAINGGHSRDALDLLLESYLLEPWPTPDGDIRVASDIDTHKVPFGQRWMRLSKEYEELITHRTPHRIRLDLMPNAGFAIDLYALFCMYTPLDQRLHVPEATLWAMLPEDSIRRTQSRYYVGAAKQLTALDNGWTYRYKRDYGFDAARPGISIDKPGMTLRVYDEE